MIRAEPVIVTVDGADRGSAAAAPTSLTFSHATWDTVKTIGMGVPTVKLSPAAWPQYLSGRDYSESPVLLGVSFGSSPFRYVPLATGPKKPAGGRCLCIDFHRLPCHGVTVQIHLCNYLVRYSRSGIKHLAN